MKILLIITMVFVSVTCVAQKKAPYVYAKVDTVVNFSDATVIIYNNKKGKHKSDTIWFIIQSKSVSIEEAHVVITDSRYLKPRIKLKRK